MKFYHYFKTNTNKIYKCESILKFAEFADKNNIKDWIVIQKICKEEIDVI